MPIRIVCPSCSAALSIKDEYAGRAVKCPKCGGVIPAAQPETPSAPPAATPPPLPAPEPAKAPFEELDEPARPAGIVGTSQSRNQDEEDEPARPARRNRDDEDDDRPRRRRRDDEEEPRGARSSREERGERDRDRDERDEDRPMRSRRRRADDDDPPAREKKGGGAGLIIALVCGMLLLCCGGIGGVTYWFVYKVKQGVEELVEKTNFRVTRFNFERLQVGTTTRAQAEEILGMGRDATTNDLNTMFATEFAAKRKAAWAEKVAAGRAIIWRNNNDYLIAAFHPDADGRLQMKEWIARTSPGGDAEVGDLDDATFLREYPAGGGTPVDVKAEELARAFDDNKGAAERKYNNKNIIVEGKLEDIDFMPSGDVYARLKGAPPTPGKAIGIQIRCVVSKNDIEKLLDTSRGQDIKLKGLCAGLSGPFVDVMNATVESSNTSANRTAAALIKEYDAVAMATDEKYKDKAITIMNAVVISKDGDASLLIGGGKNKGKTKIKVTVPFEMREQIAKKKPGDRILMIKGEYSSAFDNVIYINRAWIK